MAASRKILGGAWGQPWGDMAGCLGVEGSEIALLARPTIGGWVTVFRLESGGAITTYPSGRSPGKLEFWDPEKEPVAWKRPRGQKFYAGSSSRISDSIKSTKSSPYICEPNLLHQFRVPNPRNQKRTIASISNQSDSLSVPMRC